jgi:hypothetical protein
VIGRSPAPDLKDGPPSSRLSCPLKESNPDAASARAATSDTVPLVRHVTPGAHIASVNPDRGTTPDPCKTGRGAREAPARGREMPHRKELVRARCPGRAGPNALIGWNLRSSALGTIGAGVAGHGAWTGLGTGDVQNAWCSVYATTSGVEVPHSRPSAGHSRLDCESSSSDLR